MRSTSNAVLWTLVLLGCSSTDRGRGPEGRASGPGDTVGTLRTVPRLAPRMAGARPLVREGTGFVASERGLSVRFSGAAMHLERSPLVSLDVIPEGLAAVASTLDHAVLVRKDVQLDTDVAELFDGEVAEELRVLRTPRAPTVFSWRVRLGPALAKLWVQSGVVQALDDEGRARFRAEPLVAWDAEGIERALDVEVQAIAPGEARVIARLDPHGLRYPITVDPAWGLTNNMALGRFNAQLLQLPDGKVLVTGGRNTSAYMQAAESFDPVTMTWTLRSSMKIGREKHSAVLMTDGRVMVIGGTGSANLSSCEFWNPATDTWSDAPTLPATTWASAAVTIGGKVVVGGGAGNTANTYTYTEPDGPWATNASKLAVGRYGLAAIKYSATKALFVGGNSTSDIYDAPTNTFSAGPTLAGTRSYPGVALLTSGRVLIVGGTTAAGRSDADLFDPVTSSMLVVTGLANVHFQGGEYPAPLAALAGDKALFTGAYDTTVPNVVTDVFDGASKSWSRGPDAVIARHRGHAIGLADGRALVAGGIPGNGTAGVFSSTEIYADNVSSGGTCTSGAQCANGFCADGVCCSSACAGACESCVETGSVGTCKTVTGAPRVGHGTCVGSGTCAGTCDGTAAACTYPSSAVPCIAASCSGGVEQPAAYCNGGGACPTAPATKNCALFACGVIACKTTCTVDTDCVASAFCNATTSLCEVKKPNGGVCTNPSGCSSGFCAGGSSGSNGVCCDKACAGGCETCSASGSSGACQLRAKDSACGSDACVGSSLTVAAKCDGASNACPAPVPSPCPGGFACASDGKTCKSTCTTGADCATGFCDLATAKCAGSVSDAGTQTDAALGIAEAGAPQLPAKPAVESAFQRCAKGSDCSTGFCVDGVCCNTACEDRCHSCALLSAPGICTLEPVGVDLRNECGPANQCLGTCDGSGQCIGAGTGTMCGRNRCSGSSTGVGPAYCSAPGAKCPTNDAVPFECSPYVCEPAFGACRSSCSASSECANGFVCDVPTKSCVLPPPASDEGGCAYGTTQRSSRSTIAAMLVGLLLAGCRRRARV